MTQKLRRSMLFCPANNAKLYVDAPLYQPDCIIFDLEDATKYEEKAIARDLLAEALQALDFGKCEVYARINPLSTPFGKLDVEALVPAGLRYMRLPMSETKQQIVELDNLLTLIEQKHNIKVGSCKIQCSIETPLGVHNVYEIASASKRVVSISFGAEDYTRLLGAERTKGGLELLYAKSKITNVASILGIDAIDTVWADFKDIAGFNEEVKLIKQMGFAGKSCIHPSQIELVHNVFTPSMEEVEEALIILDGVAKAGIEKGGVIQVNGKMVDIPVIDKAKSVIKLAKGARLIK